MTISPDQYEKLGSLYLGRTYDLDARQPKDELVLYDSKDMVTHGVVLGMTGSGKTGLCLAMLEEAAIDGVPVIAIDPKGDIGNLLFTFPGLNGDKLKPWVNADDARRTNQSVDDYAAAEAGKWTQGLADWGQTPDRIQKLRDAVDMAIYTPGSSAGLPVSNLASLEAPSADFMDDREMLADRIESTVSSILALCGIDADPVQSREHILISNIIGFCWKKGQNVTIENLIRQIQQPPMSKIGVENTDAFFPEDKRHDLSMKLNNLIASPGFSAWLEGEPLDIQRMFFTAEGKPRISIFSIAHLSDTERMFFVSLLMNQLMGWMRAQSGTTSLRALFYMDEIYGYLPPVANPPSKKPMMILLKQARAFGLGLLLATQNPVDLDYKALSNIGSWFLGRLQTERDKMRVLDGLEGAITTQGAKFDRGTIDKTLSGLGNRVFLMNNVHEDGPVVFMVRWTMSYLRGPVSRNEIKLLMDPVKAQRPAAKADAGEDDGFAPPGAKAAPAASRNTIKPKLPDGVEEYFFAVNAGITAEQLCYRPAIIRSATVNFDDSKRKISGKGSITLINEIDTEKQRVDWDKTYDVAKDVDLSKFAKDPEAGDVEYLDLPSAALKSKTYDSIESDYVDWVYANYTAEVSHCELLDAWSNIGETAGDFRTRMAQNARQLRDQAIDALKQKMARQTKSAEDDLARAMSRVDAEKAQATSATISTVAQVGMSLLGAFFGNKGGTLGAAKSLVKSSTVTSASRAWKQSQDVSIAQSEVDRLKAAYDALNKSLEDETQKIRDQYDPDNLKLETEKLSPQKKNIQSTATGIIWMPYERVGANLKPAWTAE